MDWALASPATKFHAPGAAPHVTPEDKAVTVAMWRLPDRVLLAVHGGDREKAENATVRVDLDSLGLTPQLLWQEFVRVKDFTGPGADLDFYGRKLTVKNVAPRTVRYIGIRRY